MLNLYELAKVIHEDLVVSIRENQFSIEFLNCEVKDNKDSSIISFCWACGDTVDEAADKYFSMIIGKWLVFDSTNLHGRRRREYSAEIYRRSAYEQEEIR